jgi:hypothetical protein
MAAMKRPMIRLSLALLLVALTSLAAMVWTRKYDGAPDPKARFEIEAAKLRKDHSFHWLELHLRKNSEEGHDLRKPVRLVTADGKGHEPADTTFAGSPEEGFTEIWFKFWLSEDALDGPVNLRINDGKLRVKTNSGLPATFGSDGEAVFKTADWEKSWPGF